MAGEDHRPVIPSKRSSSFLLRVWLEPSESEKAAGTVRAYLRNLHTGEEQYLSDPEALTAVVRGQIREQFGKVSGDAEDRQRSVYRRADS